MVVEPPYDFVIILSLPHWKWKDTYAMWIKNNIWIIFISLKKIILFPISIIAITFTLLCFFLWVDATLSHSSYVCLPLYGFQSAFFYILYNPHNYRKFSPPLNIWGNWGWGTQKLSMQKVSVGAETWNSQLFSLHLMFKTPSFFLSDQGCRN